MHKPALYVAATILLASAATAQDVDPRIAKSRAAAQSFQGALQGELQAAMKAGGPVNAIGVCNTRAAAIATDTSSKEGLKIGRTSLKVRNPANAPDAWELETLQLFEQRKAAGESPANLERTATVGSEFRYMKAIAIPEGAPCLACHGEAIDAAVATRLRELYPSDKATGYKQGELRGAFTIRQAP
jgi:hypothetical protein